MPTTLSLAMPSRLTISPAPSHDGWIQDVAELVQFIAIHGEGDVGGAANRDILHDDVDDDVGFCQGREDPGSDTGTIRDVGDSDLCLVAFDRNAMRTTFSNPGVSSLTIVPLWVLKLLRTSRGP